MKIKLKLTQLPYKMQAEGSAMEIVKLDKPEHLENGELSLKNATSPTELLLEALAGCTSIDLLYILNKQKAIIKLYEMEVVGERKDVGGAKPFSKITLYTKVETDASEEKVRRAIELSLEKYCSVKLSLNPDIEFNYNLDYKQIK